MKKKRSGSCGPIGTTCRIGGTIQDFYLDRDRPKLGVAKKTGYFQGGGVYRKEYEKRPAPAEGKKKRSSRRMECESPKKKSLRLIVRVGAVWE